MDNLCGDVGRGRGLLNGVTAVRWEGGRAKEAKAALRNPVRGEWGPAERHLKRSTSSRLGGDNLELRWTRQTCWAGFKQHCLRYVHKWPNANAQPLWMKHRETGRFALSLAFGKSERAQKRHYQPVFPLYLPWQGQTCTHLTMPQFVMAVFIIKQKKRRSPRGASLPVPTSDICEAARSQTAWKCWRGMRRKTVAWILENIAGLVEHYFTTPVQQTTAFTSANHLHKKL